MKFECDSCHAQYMIADEKVGKRGVKVKCKKCQHVIIVRPDGPAASAGKTKDGDEKAATAPRVEKAAEKSSPALAGALTEVVDRKEALKPPPQELPQQTLAQPPPPGFDVNMDAPSDTGDTFAQGGPTDPGVPDMAAQQQVRPKMDGKRSEKAEKADKKARAEERRAEEQRAQEQAQGDDEKPETTGPNLAPAPVSLFGGQPSVSGEMDATQLTKNPMSPAPSEPENNRKHDDKTELGGPSGLQNKQAAQMTDQDEKPREEKRAKNDATVVSPQNLPSMSDDDVPAPPPAPPRPAGHDDALDDQLAGAFNAMFDPSQASSASLSSDEEGGQHRGPTKVLDLEAMDALRKQSAGRPAMKDVKDGPDPRELFEAGLVRADAKGNGAAAAGADDGPADQVWHVAIDDQDVGPLSLAEVGRHIEAGRVDRESLVWKVGMDDWLPAGEVPSVRALFDKVPMPRIARVDDEPKADGKRRPPSNDVGPPLDDGLPPHASPNAHGASPFDENSGDDDSWRPHGLTDVYQAANLAEAAGANFGGGALGSIGGSSAAVPSVSPMKAQASAEPEWRPAAASALASLVNDEIKRIDNGPPPASDDDLAPADDASINAPLFGSSLGKDLDAGPAVADPVAQLPRNGGALPTFNAQSMSGGPMASPSYPPPGGFSSQVPAQRGLSPAIIAAIAAAGAVVLALVVVVVVLVRPGDKDQFVIGPDGKPYVTVNGKLVPVATGDDKKPDVDPSKIAANDPKKADDPKVDVKANDPAKTDPPKTDDKIASAAKTPTNDDDGNDKPAASSAKTERHDVAKVAKTEHHEEHKEQPRKEEVEKPAKAAAVDEKPKSVGKCDPVLDFDCKPGGTPADGGRKPKTEDAPSDLKDKLAQTDVLQVVKQHLGAVQACGRKNKASGVIKMSWKIQPRGGVSDVAVQDSKFAGTPVGSCVAAEIKGWKFPATKASSSVPVTFPMNLGN